MAENDISALLQFADFALVMTISAGGQSLQETEMLVEKLGKVEINIGDGLTLLHLAAASNRVEIVEYLCSNDHSVELRTSAGETPLDQASWKGSLESAIILIKYGADVDCQTNSKYTPLHRCAFYNHARFASILCLAGATQTLKDKDGNTAYDVAVAEGNEKLVELLKPLFNEKGENLAGMAYATNNPKHPNFRPEARESLLQLFSCSPWSSD